ncbi:integral membrane protein, partial [Cadophora sp. DSE1049]
SGVVAVMIAFLAVAIYNAVELFFVSQLTFKRRSGIYFYAILVATCGIFVNAIGYVCNHFKLIPIHAVTATIIIIGWTSMVTGQSVVLWSRLHLVVRNHKKIRWVLIMIITNAIILHIPVTALVFGVNSSNPEPFKKPYSVYEKVQLTVFVLQEMLISGMYVFETIHILKPISSDSLKAKARSTVLHHLIYVNIAIILMDSALLGLEYSGHTEIQTAFKPMLYSIKLKLEFSILNKLIAVIRGSSETGSHTPGHYAEHHSHPLKTFVGTRNDKGTHLGVVHTSIAFGSTNDHINETNDNKVMKTTEIRVERTNAQGEEYEVSFDGKDVGRASGGDRTPGQTPRGPPSITSSEAGFAKAG